MQPGALSAPLSYGLIFIALFAILDKITKQCSLEVQLCKFNEFIAIIVIRSLVYRKIILDWLLLYLRPPK